MLTVNPKDVTVVVPKQDFHFEAMFEGVELALAHQEQEVVHTDVKGKATSTKLTRNMTFWTVFCRIYRQREDTRR